MNGTGGMSLVNDFIQRSADRIGYNRIFAVAKNLPTTPSNVVAVPLYGDIRSIFIASSLLLKSYKEANPDKYIIVCSYQGFEGLFPYVDEYWSLKDEESSKLLSVDIENSFNKGKMYAELQKSIIECMNVLTPSDLQKWYSSGLTRDYFSDFKEVKRYLPEVPSSNSLSSRITRFYEENKGPKVILYPTTKLWSWQKGKNVHLPISKDFWDAIINVLIESGFVPVLYQNWQTYDMSGDFLNKCIYVVPRNVTDVLAAMRYTGLVLDIHSGISRLAVASRTPFVSVDERMRFIQEKEYEIDDLCCSTPRKYIFSFSTMLMAGDVNNWRDSIIDNVVVQLNSMLSNEDRSLWGSTNESYETVSYDTVRERKSKRLGLSFISSSK